MDLLMRRRAMMLAAEGGSTWDVEWDYTMGLPTVCGFERVVNGNTFSETLTETSLTFQGRTSGNYIEYQYPGSYSKAVIEVSFKTEPSQQNFIWLPSLTAGEEKGASLRCQCSANYKGVYLPDATAVADMTKLQGFALNTSYIVKIVLNDGYADFWVNDVLRGGHVDISTLLLYTTYNRIRFQAAGSQTVRGYLYYIKMKLGHI